MTRRDLPPTLARIPWLMARFMPVYVRHLAIRPYRPGRALDHLRELLTAPARRHHIAMYDAVLEIMVKGYGELTGQALRPDTGRMAVMITRVGFAFDDEHERRAAVGESTSFADILDSAAVLGPLRDWREFMAGHDAYARIRPFLTAYVSNLHRSYLENSQDRAPDFDTLLTGATIDSGGLLVTLAHLIAQFHDGDADERTLAQFSSLGVNGKLADDIVDFRADVAGGRPNLLHILAAENAGEHARMLDALAGTRRLQAAWWRRNCPQAYARLIQAYAHHHGTLTSRRLRYASDLMWTPAALGHSRPIETRGRI